MATQRYDVTVSAELEAETLNETLEKLVVQLKNVIDDKAIEVDNPESEYIDINFRSERK